LFEVGEQVNKAVLINKVPTFPDRSVDFLQVDDVEYGEDKIEEVGDYSGNSSALHAHLAHT